MGSQIAKEMKTNMAENQKSMIQAQRELMLKQRQLQLAVEFSRGKERFYWYSVFYAGVLIGTVAGLLHGNKKLLLPCYPISFMWAYQYDLYYGNKQERIRKMAEEMIASEPERFWLPVNNLLISQEEYNAIFNGSQTKVNHTGNRE
jgi:hypothetical protein